LYCSWPPQASRAIRPRSSSIEGFVTLNTANYLAGVTVGVANQVRGGHFEVRTNTSGYYVFEDIRPGTYTMWADAQGMDAF
jgi:Carboxypeptidase regulatory-like domain